MSSLATATWNAQISSPVRTMYSVGRMNPNVSLSSCAMEYFCEGGAKGIVNRAVGGLAKLVRHGDDLVDLSVNRGGGLNALWWNNTKV
jgi:hypothetical protein